MIKKKILFLSSWYPFPTDNGSKLRIYNLLRGLATDYDVSLISFTDSQSAAPNAGELKSICKDVTTIPYRQFNPKSMKARLGFLSRTPRAFIDTYSNEMAERIRETIAVQKPNLVIASQIGTAMYRHSYRMQPAVFEEVEIGLSYENNNNGRLSITHLRNRLTWLKHRQYLVNLIHNFQACTVVSDSEKKLLLSLDPNNSVTEIVPNCINISDYPEIKQIRQPNQLIFTGSFSYYPNYEAIAWFLSNVFPLVLINSPLTKLVITGKHDGHFLESSKNVTLSGYVEDVRPLIAGSTISIAPIISGGGTRLKILEAMALHTPVVTTRKGAEGLDVNHGLNILIADSPEEFASNVNQLLNDPELRQKLANNAFQLVMEKYEWSVVMPSFLNLVESTLNNKN